MVETALFALRLDVIDPVRRRDRALERRGDKSPDEFRIGADINRVTVIAAMSLRGYCRTLIVFIACKPAMRMTKLTTSASTGRLMKRSVKDFMSILAS